MKKTINDNNNNNNDLFQTIAHIDVNKGIV